MLPPRRGEREREAPHPVVRGVMDTEPCRSFARDEVRDTVIPTYMGLVKQIDDQLGLLFASCASAAWIAKR